jgi:hypothetical protein
MLKKRLESNGEIPLPQNKAPESLKMTYVFLFGRWIDSDYQERSVYSLMEIAFSVKS